MSSPEHILVAQPPRGQRGFDDMIRPGGGSVGQAVEHAVFLTRVCNSEGARVLSERPGR